MSRRRRAVRREIHSDAKFGSRLVGRLMNIVMQRGKHNLAQRIVYGAFEQMEDKQGGHAVEILERAVENIKPRLEVKSRREGGATYQVPLEVSGDRSEALAKEILEAYEGEGGSVRRRDEMHRMAQANKAFAHFRW